MQGWTRRETRLTVTKRHLGRSLATQTEESYLRDDIPCGSEACRRCPQTTPTLSACIAAYVIPDAETLHNCLDIFESPDLRDNLLVLASVARRAIGNGNVRFAARLRALYRDRRRHCILFDNLHHIDTAPSSTSEIRAKTDVLVAADWYYRHLSERATVIVVSDGLAQQLGCSTAAGSTRAVSDVGDVSLTPGVHIISEEEYFQGRWSRVPAVACMYDSMRRIAEERTIPGRDFASSEKAAARMYTRPYLSRSLVDAGLEAGTLVGGKLHVSARYPRSFAVVLPRGGLKHRAVVVKGRAAMNRALHGDTVAVKLMSRGAWAAHDVDGEADGGTGVHDGGDVTTCEQQQGEENAEDVFADAHATDLDSGLLAGSADDVAEAAATGAGSDAGNIEDILRSFLSDRKTPETYAVGEVVAVLQRASQEIVACISEDDETALKSLAAQEASAVPKTVLCVPSDRRLPRVRLRSRQLPRLVGKKLVMRIDGWDPGSNYPYGHVLRVLGNVGDLTAETDAILATSGIKWQPFSEAALRELPIVPSTTGEWVLTPAQTAAELAAGRRDLRDEEAYYIVSIDPPGCTDVDDAMHVSFLNDGDVEVGVHIADVSWFVCEGSALDAEAAARCTTVYLVDRRLDMLPGTLSEDAASLKAGRDRLAVSVLWTLRCHADGSYDPKDVWFGRTLIRSRHQLEYQQAQNVLDGIPEHPALSTADKVRLKPALQILTQLANFQRARRLEAGALELESAELRFQTGPDGQPRSVMVKHEISMMRTVAEMMIMANAAVAERIYAADPGSALLRGHAPPKPEAIDQLRHLCKSVGVELPDSQRIHSMQRRLSEEAEESLGAALRIAAERAPADIATLIRAAATRAMSEAQYFCQSGSELQGGFESPSSGLMLGHYGLALPLYTHFTSPIRRYADVVVHRQLLATVPCARFSNDISCPVAPFTGAKGGTSAKALMVPSVAQVAVRAFAMNERHRAAKRAQKGCADLFLLLLLHSKPHAERAVILGLSTTAHGHPTVDVFVPKYHTQASIHLADKNGVPRPPLRTHEDEDERDSRTLAARRGIELRVEPGEDDHPMAAIFKNPTTNEIVAKLTPMQRVWVEMGASSKAAGPVLRVRLLADCHPHVRQAGKTQGQQALPPRTSSLVQSSQRAHLPPGLPFSNSERVERRERGALPMQHALTRLPGHDGPRYVAEHTRTTLETTSDVDSVVEQLGRVGLYESCTVDQGDTSAAASLLAEASAGNETQLIKITTTSIIESLANTVMKSAANALRAKAARYALRAASAAESNKAAQWASKADHCRKEADLLLDYVKHEQHI